MNAWISTGPRKVIHAPCRDAGATCGGQTRIAGRGARVCADCGAYYSQSPPPYGDTETEMATVMHGHTHGK